MAKPHFLQPLLARPARRFIPLGMRFPIDVVLVNREGHVLKTRANMPRARLSGALRAFAVIELPAGAIERTGVWLGDTLVPRQPECAVTMDDLPKGPAHICDDV